MFQLIFLFHTTELHECLKFFRKIFLVNIVSCRTSALAEETQEEKIEMEYFRKSGNLYFFREERENLSLFLLNKMKNLVCS